MILACAGHWDFLRFAQKVVPLQREKSQKITFKIDMDIEKIISERLCDAMRELYSAELTLKDIQVQKTRKEFEGNYTVVVFPLTKISHQKPEELAQNLGTYFVEKSEGLVEKFNVIKGFLNLTIGQKIWESFLRESEFNEQFGHGKPAENGLRMVEFSSPNTNKPLHLGHIRNNLLGWSIYKIMEAAGHRVMRVNLVNDRGIHICKSMLAWSRFGEGKTPEMLQKKGDHVVGDYYVLFDKHYKEEVRSLVNTGLSEEEAQRKAPLMQEAQAMLKRWEEGDAEVRSLWEKMNGWVYEGFGETYRRLGIEFDRVYYESQTYLFGKEIVREGLEKGVFYRRDDGSVWIDLRADGLDEKLLLRQDQTSVYITQDLGTAQQRFAEYSSMDKMIYVVGNEQIYHFHVLKLILQKLGYAWSEGIYHMSYGMVELPNGKMKSREGTVVDADDLMDEMVSTAEAMSRELGKLDDLTEAEASEIVRMIGLGALKYFILKVDPKKTMLFDPAESIDFNGNTGPFIQYTHARICSLIRKAEAAGIDTSSAFPTGVELSEKEVRLIQMLYDFAATIQDAAAGYSPALIANYVYELAKEFNQFYHDFSILREEDAAKRLARVLLSKYISAVLRNGLDLLGIEAPSRM